MQGVWGAARPPSGEREGQRPLASLANAQQLQRGARGEKPARIRATVVAAPFALEPKT